MAKVKAVEDSEALPLKAVLYTDGGCKPSRGIGGFGVHGYIFTEATPKQGSGCKSAHPTARGYVEGDEGKRNAVTVVKYIDQWGSLIPESTNNQAELTAAFRALEEIFKQDVVSLLVMTDSQYVCKGIQEWIWSWLRNNWVKADGTPVPNAEHWQRLNTARQAFIKKAEGTELTWQWVKGHDGNLGNELADRHASRGIIAGRKGLTKDEVELTDAKGYWNNSTEYNRMLSQTRWYFNTHVNGAMRSPDGRWVYHLGDHGKDDELFGKRISDACFSVVYLEQPDPVLEHVRAYQDEIDPSNFNSVVIGRLDNLLSTGVYTDVSKYGSLFLQRPHTQMDLYTAEELPVTKELRPARLAFNAVSTLMVLENTLNDFLSDPKDRGLMVTDLTEMLYDVEQTKKGPVCKLKPSITSSTRSIKVDAQYNTGAREGVVDVTLTVGIDLARRNTLAALAVHNPTVSLLTWRESDKGFRYATVIKAGGDVGIWAGVYSNLRLLDA